jgi:mono/diheme cytochrome c family protein
VSGDDDRIERGDPVKEKDLQSNAVPVNRAYERENYEPAELKNPLPMWFSAMALSFVLWGAGYFFFQGVVPADAGDHRSVQAPAGRGAEVDGKVVYAANCVACHQGNGQGITGAFPPLAGAGWVLAEPEVPAQILLHGMQGPIEVKGQSYAGVMPVMAHLSDEELAAVLNYIRSDWGNDAPPVTVEWFAEQRALFPEDRGPWQGEAELRSTVGEPAADGA